jgi:prephenate dehydratase
MQTLTLGPAGTYSHRAAKTVADGDIAFTESVTAIVESVAGGHHGRGVVPVENSIEGSVTEALDAFTDHEVAVVREIITPIRHALLAQTERFETVASHAQALAQCRSYLEQHHPEVTPESVTSTARGVQRAREDAAVAAIGHPANADSEDTASTAENSGSSDDGGELRVLAEDIQDRTSNATRFLVVAPLAQRSEAGSKTTFIVYPSVDYPGLLLRMLEPFAENDINLTRVESRPSGERLGDYVFHIDIAAGLYEQRTQEALAAVEEIAEDGWVRRLGSYDSETVLY